MRKIKIISYSWTGNNDLLSDEIASKLSAERIKIAELNKRNYFTVALDVLFNRKPKTDFDLDKIRSRDFIIFVSPIWIGKVSFPLREVFEKIKDKEINYAFVSISGGIAPNNLKRIENELEKRIGKAPKKIIDKHLANLFPKDKTPGFKEVFDFKVDKEKAEKLADEIISELNLNK